MQKSSLQVVLLLRIRLQEVTNMRYEKPEMFIVALEEEDIVRTSETLGDIGTGGTEDGSTKPFIPPIN